MVGGSYPVLILPARCCRYRVRNEIMRPFVCGLLLMACQVHADGGWYWRFGNLGKSCDDVCGRLEGTCSVGGLLNAAQSIEKCRFIVDSFGGLSYSHWGQEEDDRSGCTYGDWGAADKRSVQANRPLESSHPFEQLKRLVYLHNTPASVGAEVAGSRLVEEVAQYSRSRP